MHSYLRRPISTCWFLESHCLKREIIIYNERWILRLLIIDTWDVHTWPAPTSITSFTDLDSAVFAINAARILICTLDTTGLPLMFVYVTASLLNSTSILIINQKRVTPNSCHYLLLRNIDLQLHFKHKTSLSYSSPYILQQWYNKWPYIPSPSISTGLSYSHAKQAATIPGKT